MDSVELDFMSGLLCMDPEKRLTGAQCLQHPYLAGLAAKEEEVGVTDLLAKMSLEAVEAKSRRQSGSGDLDEEGEEEDMDEAEEEEEEEQEGEDAALE